MARPNPHQFTTGAFFGATLALILCKVSGQADIPIVSIILSAVGALGLFIYDFIMMHLYIKHNGGYDE